MTEQEILKAAEICSRKSECDGCPLKEDCGTMCAITLCSEKFAEYIVGKIQNENNDGEMENIKACYNSLSEARSSVNEAIVKIYEVTKLLNSLKSYIATNPDSDKEGLK